RRRSELGDHPRLSEQTIRIAPHRSSVIDRRTSAQRLDLQRRSVARLTSALQTLSLALQRIGVTFLGIIAAGLCGPPVSGIQMATMRSSPRSSIRFQYAGWWHGAA